MEMRDAGEEEEDAQEEENNEQMQRQRAAAFQAKGVFYVIWLAWKLFFLLGA